MSADDALFVQVNINGQFVVQHGFMSSDVLPDPESSDGRIYNNIAQLVYSEMANANLTEYGFKFIFDPARVSRLTPGIWKYKTKPQEVDVVRWTGLNLTEMTGFILPHKLTVKGPDIEVDLAGLKTLVKPGDAVVKYPDVLGYKCFTAAAFALSFDTA